MGDHLGTTVDAITDELRELHLDQARQAAVAG